MFKIFTSKSRLFLIPLVILLLAGSFICLPNLSETALAQDAPAGAANAAPATNNPATGGAVTNTPGGTDGGIPTFFGYGFMDFINFGLASFMNFLLGMAAFLLTMAASIMDVSLIMTLHIKDFVEATPAIYTIWQVIRDITGLFFIFFLLYAAIQMMLNMGGSYGKLIKDIVVAGILINFSFFIVSVFIDASNIVSQAIYNSMNPSAQTIEIDKDTKLRDLTSNITGLNQNTSTAKGISNIFMNSLKIQSIYDTSGNKLTSVIGNPIRIILVGLTGVIIMITAAASFILAALAFIARLVILLFLLMFSSLWFAGRIIPQLNTYIGKFTGALYSQMFFMPVYLLLMYAALRILNESNLMGAANASIQSLPTGANWAFPFIVLAINFAMVIFMLNLPLAVGLGMGGPATDLFKKTIDKWDAGKIWGNIGGKAWGGTYKNTVSRAASAISRNEGLKNIASKSKVGELALKGIRGTASDYNKTLEGQVEARTKFAESLGYNQNAVNTWEARVRDLGGQLRALDDTPANAAARATLQNDIKNAKRIIGEMKLERKEQYMERIDRKSPDTLWTKVARKDKKAAAKIQVDVYESELKDKKESLKEVRADIKQLQAAIRNNPAVNGNPAGTATDAQQREIDKLTQKANDAQTEVDTMENNLALEKLDASR